jgi:hypothetical protein
VHQPPVVDALTLEVMRRRLAFGLLGLEQPSSDLYAAANHFAYRWSHSLPPPPPQPWQQNCLDWWRHHPRSCNLHPVVDALISGLRLEDGTSLDKWLPEQLFELARSSSHQEVMKPHLKFAWQQISQGVQRLRQGTPSWQGGQPESGIGAFSAEGEAALRRLLQALQPLQGYFSAPSASLLEETSRRWTQASQDWDEVVHCCLTGLQPVSSAILWGQWLEQMPAPAALLQAGQNALTRWFLEWSCDLVHSLCPYQAQILGLEPALEQLGLAMLRWQKLLPGWHQEVTNCWNHFLDAVPGIPASRGESAMFRWLSPDLAMEARWVGRNPWRAWLKLAADVPPRGPAQQDALRLQQRLRLSRLFTTLVEPAFSIHQVEFPEHAWAHEASDWLHAWLDGYDPLSPPLVELISKRIGQLEQLLLRDFPVSGRTVSPHFA